MILSPTVFVSCAPTDPFDCPTSQLRDGKQVLFRNQPPFLGPSGSEIARKFCLSKGVLFHRLRAQTRNAFSTSRQCANPTSVPMPISKSRNPISKSRCCAVKIALCGRGARQCLDQIGPIDLTAISETHATQLIKRHCESEKAPGVTRHPAHLWLAAGCYMSLDMVL